MTELPYINGKTIKTISTMGRYGSIDEVRIAFTDGAILVLSLVLSGECIRLTLETVAIETQPAQPTITGTTRWAGEGE